MKKILPVILQFTLLAGVAGCGGIASTAKGGGAPPEESLVFLPLSNLNVENKEEFQRLFKKELKNSPASRANEILIHEFFCSGLQKYLNRAAIQCLNGTAIAAGDVRDTLLTLPRDSLPGATEHTFTLPTPALLEKFEITSGFVLLVDRPHFSGVYFPPYKKRIEAENEGVRLQATYIVWNVSQNRIESRGTLFSTRTEAVQVRYSPIGMRNPLAKQLWTFTTDHAAVQIAYGTPRFLGDKARSYFRLFGPGPW
jgi:hypothetical protein